MMPDGTRRGGPMKTTEEMAKRLSRWNKAQNAFRHARKLIDATEKELASATESLGDFLSPKDATPGEIFSVWVNFEGKDRLVGVRVPDLDALIDKYNQKLLDADQLSYFLYGGQDYPYNFHYNGFTYNSLKTRLLRAGFKSVSDKTQSDNNFIIKI